MADRVTFPATIRVYYRKETGESWIIRDPKWLDEEYDRQMSVFTDRLDASFAVDPLFLAMTPEQQNESRDRATGAFAKNFNAMRARHEAAFEEAKEYNLLLVKPTHREVTAARAKAKIVDNETGNISYDNEVLLEAIMPGHVEDDEGKVISIDSLDSEPLVEEIRLLLWRAIRPVESRLPF